MRKCFATTLLLLIGCILLLAAGPLQASATTEQLFWEKASQEIYKSPGELKAQHEREIRKGEIYIKLMQGDPHIKAVALTFDDGPHPKFTSKILEILRKYHVNATFFVVGKMAKKYPKLVEQEFIQGNLIGNHTYDHYNLTKIPDPEVDVQWQKGNEIIRSITGIEPMYCRPPGGDYDRGVIKSAMMHGLTTVLWTDDPGDYANPGDKTIENRVLDRIADGSIILIHDGIQQTIDVLPQIIETLQKKGFKFETVAEMAAAGHPEALRMRYPITSMRPAASLPPNTLKMK